MKKSFLISCFILMCSFITHSLHAQKEKKSGGLKKFLGVHVEEFHDKFEGSITYRMKGNKVKIKGAVGTGIAKGVLGVMTKNAQFSIITTRLQLENHILKDSSQQLSVILKVTINDDARFWVMAGESLIFLVDGKRIGLSTGGDFNAQAGFDGSGSFDSKTNARYLVTKEQLETILKAKTVDFRIMQEGLLQGEAEDRDKKDTHFEGSFSKKNFKAWQNFYQDYIINIPQK